MNDTIFLKFSRSMWVIFVVVLAHASLVFQAGTARAEAIEYVVFSIEGSVADLSLGQVLKEGYRFEIPDNARVNLISKKGEIITLDGPVAATVTKEEDNAKGEQALASLSSRLFDDNKFVQTIGGTRSTTNETDLQKLLYGQNVNQAWLPVISSAEVYCLKREKAVLRSERADTDARVRIGDSEVMVWKVGVDKLPLDDTFKTDESGGLYLSIDERKILVFISDIGSASVASEVAWLAEKGCVNQALQLLASKTPGT